MKKRSKYLHILETTQFSQNYVLKFRKKLFIAVLHFITLPNNLHFILQNDSKFSYNVQRNRVLNTVLPSVFPETAQFSRNCIFKFTKLLNFALFLNFLINNSIINFIMSQIIIFDRIFLKTDFLKLEYYYAVIRLNFFDNFCS